MKKFLALLLVLVLGITAGIGGTVAYLTDTEEAVNVMTVGNVEIAQHEYERALKADGTFATDTFDNQTSYVLKEFTQAKPLLPIVGDPSLPGDNPGYAGWDATTVRMSQVDSYGGMQVFAGKNAQDKFVTVENTGDFDAYVRTIVAIEVGTANAELIGISARSTVKAEEIGKQPWFENEIGTVVINGNNYYVIEYTYAGAQLSDGSWRHEGGKLPAGETSYPNLSQVYLSSKATNEDVNALDGNGNGTIEILVFTQAVQADGFDKAETALDTAFGAADEANVLAWFTGEEFTVPATVDTADELIEALEGNEDVILTDDVKIEPASMSNAYGTTGINVLNGQTIDGGGNVLDIKGAGGTWDSGICTSGGLIKDITVTGSFRGIFIKNNAKRVYLENVTIEGTTYTISCDQGADGGLTATNSTFRGWTSFAKTIGDVKFVGCTFGAGAGYNYSRPYAPTEYVNCNFEAGHQIDARAAVTFENCTIGGVALTAENLSTLVTSNIANASVK